MPKEVHCADILVRSERDARAVVDRLNRREKFSKVAREVSVCPSTFGRGRMVKEFEQAAFSLQKGQVSLIVKARCGYHIIRRLE